MKKEFIRFRVTRTVEEIVEYTPDRHFYGDKISLVEIAESAMKALSNGMAVSSNLESLGESGLVMRVEISDYGIEDPEASDDELDYEFDLEEGLIEDEY